MTPPDDRPPALPDDLVTRLYRRSGAEHWSLTQGRFGEALRRSVAHRFGAAPAPPDRATLAGYLDALHLEDLALACACRDGVESAWDLFARDVQPHVRAAGRAMAGASGEELADGLISELFGTTIRNGERRSLLDYFHGRSRLTTWLRTVLAQRHVDRLRATRREAPLDAAAGRPDGSGGTMPERRRHDPGEIGTDQSAGRAEQEAVLAADRSHLLAAFHRELARALDGLEAGDRLRLAYYHVDGLTLARIGRLVGEHESSVSRKLDRSRRRVRADVERALRERHGFGDADLLQCYEDTGRHGNLDLTRLFGSREADSPQDRAAPAFKAQDVP